MKPVLLACLAALGLAATTARADHVDIRGHINFGEPGYMAPCYVTPDRGYWRDVVVNVWVPPHWEIRHNRWGRPIRLWEPGHYEARPQRVWVDAYQRAHDRDRWQRERDEHEYRRGWDDRR
jgi:hypothetical protein